MARFCVVVVTAVCCLVTGSYADDDAGGRQIWFETGIYTGPKVDATALKMTMECSVEGSGVLTMFNGQTSTVAVPCKYRLADIQCGDYQLRITPGSKLDSNNTFSPNSVFARIQKTGLAGYAWVLTTSSRLEKFAEGKVENPWQLKRGNLSSFGLDLAGYDSAKQAAVLRKDGVFEVEFSADQASVVVRCFSDSFSSKPQPDALCGDGEPGNAVTKEEILVMVFTNSEVFQRPRPSCPRAVSMYQECPAGVNNTMSCSDVLLNQATVDCLAASGTSLIDHYNRCLAAVCDVDASALNATLAYIEHNCALDPGSDCSNDLLAKCDSQSTCEGGAICKRKLEQSCAGFSDHCVNGTTCDPDTKICVTEDGGWLYKPCITDRDCPEARTTCFEGQCLCIPGYSYSMGRNTCVEGCISWDRLTNFLKYPGSYVNGNMLGETYQASAENCLQWCLNVEQCHAADYYLSRKLCVIQDGYVSEWITGSSTDSTHYQVMCGWGSG